MSDYTGLKQRTIENRQPIDFGDSELWKLSWKHEGKKTFEAVSSLVYKTRETLRLRLGEFGFENGYYFWYMDNSTNWTVLFVNAESWSRANILDHLERIGIPEPTEIQRINDDSLTYLIYSDNDSSPENFPEELKEYIVSAKYDVNTSSYFVTGKDNGIFSPGGISEPLIDFREGQNYIPIPLALQSFHVGSVFADEWLVTGDRENNLWLKTKSNVVIDSNMAVSEGDKKNVEITSVLPVGNHVKAIDNIVSEIQVQHDERIQKYVSKNIKDFSYTVLKDKKSALVKRKDNQLFDKEDVLDMMDKSYEGVVPEKVKEVKVQMRKGMEKQLKKFSEGFELLVTESGTDSIIKRKNGKSFDKQPLIDAGIIPAEVGRKVKLVEDYRPPDVLTFRRRPKEGDSVIYFDNFKDLQNYYISNIYDTQRNNQIYVWSPASLIIPNGRGDTIYQKGMERPKTKLHKVEEHEEIPDEEVPEGAVYVITFFDPRDAKKAAKETTIVNNLVPLKASGKHLFLKKKKDEHLNLHSGLLAASLKVHYSRYGDIELLVPIQRPNHEGMDELQTMINLVQSRKGELNAALDYIGVNLDLEKMAEPGEYRFTPPEMLTPGGKSVKGSSSKLEGKSKIKPDAESLSETYIVSKVDEMMEKVEAGKSEDVSQKDWDETLAGITATVTNILLRAIRFGTYLFLSKIIKSIGLVERESLPGLLDIAVETGDIEILALVLEKVKELFADQYKELFRDLLKRHGTALVELLGEEFPEFLTNNPEEPADLGEELRNLKMTHKPNFRRWYSLVPSLGEKIIPTMIDLFPDSVWKINEYYSHYFAEQEIDLNNLPDNEELLKLYTMYAKKVKGNLSEKLLENGKFQEICNSAVVSRYIQGQAPVVDVKRRNAAKEESPEEKARHEMEELIISSNEFYFMNFQQQNDGVIIHPEPEIRSRDKLSPSKTQPSTNVKHRVIQESESSEESD